MKLTLHETRCIEDVATAAVATLPSLPHAARASRLRGIALIFTLIGRNGHARYANETADLLQELQRAETQLHIKLHGDNK